MLLTFTGKVLVLRTLPIVSGAFRRDTAVGIGGLDAEEGEDADLAMNLRRADWRILFAPDARALTKVPEIMPALVAQRLQLKGLLLLRSSYRNPNIHAGVMRQVERY